jgi:hypothetical protein
MLRVNLIENANGAALKTAEIRSTRVYRSCPPCLGKKCTLILTIEAFTTDFRFLDGKPDLSLVKQVNQLQHELLSLLTPNSTSF